MEVQELQENVLQICGRKETKVFENKEITEISGIENLIKKATSSKETGDCQRT